MDNIYVCVDGSVVKQCVGIPMGTDCAPVVANLFPILIGILMTFYVLTTRF